MTITDTETVELATPTGPMRTYILRPAATGRYPAIILFSEIFQVTGPIRRTAAFLAGHGFIVAVPEVYHELEAAGSVIPYDQGGAERGNAHKIAKEVAAYDADARAVIDHLKARPDCTGKLGCAGICLGGHLSFRCAMNPEILAGICFYATDIHKRSLGKGMSDNSLDRIKEITGEMLMIWGRQDPHIPTEGRRLIYNALVDAGTTFTWHEFNGQHAFMRDEGARYDPALARLCYDLALETLRRRLHGGDLRTAASSAESRH